VKAAGVALACPSRNGNDHDRTQKGCSSIDASVETDTGFGIDASAETDAKVKVGTCLRRVTLLDIPLGVCTLSQTARLGTTSGRRS